MKKILFVYISLFMIFTPVLSVYAAEPVYYENEKFKEDKKTVVVPRRSAPASGAGGLIMGTMQSILLTTDGGKAAYNQYESVVTETDKFAGDVANKIVNKTYNSLVPNTWELTSAESSGVVGFISAVYEKYQFNVYNIGWYSTRFKNQSGENLLLGNTKNSVLGVSRYFSITNPIDDGVTHYVFYSKQYVEGMPESPVVGAYARYFGSAVQPSSSFYWYSESYVRSLAYRDKDGNYIFDLAWSHRVINQEYSKLINKLVSEGNELGSISSPYEEYQNYIKPLKLSVPSSPSYAVPSFPDYPDTNEIPAIVIFEDSPGVHYWEVPKDNPKYDSSRPSDAQTNPPKINEYVPIDEPEKQPIPQKTTTPPVNDVPSDPDDAPTEWDWWKSLDLLGWFAKIIAAIVQIPIAIIDGIIDLISKLFIPEKPISETFSPLFEQFKSKFNTPEDFAFIAGNFDMTGQSCSIKDIEADLMGKEMKVFDSGALLTTSTWFKPIMSGFMWLLFGFWAFRKVNAIVAKNGGTR